MSEQKQPVWPFVLMLIIYALMLAGSGAVLLLGLAFGSEAYRDRGIPFAELAMMAGPFMVSLGLLIATILLWNAKQYKTTYILFGACFVMFFISLFAGFGLVI